MILGVISDTHFHDIETGRRKIEALSQGVFSDVDMVLHAGDLGPPDVLFRFAPRPVFAVRGNTDVEHIDLPDQRVLTLEGVRIGLVHGWGASEGLEERVTAHFAPHKVDLLVFGHSHLPVYTRQGGLVLFNPGSLSRPRSASGATIGKLTLVDGTIEGEILAVSPL